MAKALIIVESPTKIKTLRKFFGAKYNYTSSVGHVRDLPEKEFGIDLEGSFEPQYTILSGKKKVIKEMLDSAKGCDEVYLCPDPDREGEAIAWHITHLFPKGTKFRRVVFHSITKKAVEEAIAHPRSINQAVVNAQQARRLLDRIVGYKISPLLNRKLQRGRTQAVSAGRVQSVALKLVVDREKEIEAFQPVEYWNLGALLQKETSAPFHAYLYSVEGKRVEKEAQPGKKLFLIPDKATAESLLKTLKKGTYTVTKVDKKEKKRHPVPPFITSTLQQEASRYFGFTSSRTMKVAQQLYEGIDLGSQGSQGLITYMRTDSVQVVPEAVQEVRKQITKTYGKEYLPEKPNYYSSKKSAQEAHEAIRPVSTNFSPDEIKKHLTKEQFQLYQLIWRRFLASQMNPAIYDTVSADINCPPNLVLRATGSVQKYQGFLIVYAEKNDEEDSSDETKQLPNLVVNDSLSLVKATSEQAFTRPPPRFTEASLIKELEKSGIGRPSTYATIMTKIQSRDYTEKENKRLKPTELGKVIAQMLETSFQQIMDVDFTVKMEDALEQVAEEKKDWKELLEEFWKLFAPTLEIAQKEAHVPKIPTDLPCPKCKEGNLQKVWSKSKYFFGCERYPDCDFTTPIEQLTFDKSDYAEGFNWEQACPLCKKEMTLRHGRYGAFLGCSGYPDCRGIVNIPKKGETFIPPEDLPSCPAVGCEGKIVSRKSRFGKTFFSCSAYPDCDVIGNSVDAVVTKYKDRPQTAYVKKTKGKAAGGKTAKGATKKRAAKKPRAQPEYKLSEELAAVTGASSLSRGQVVKKIWDYIKAHKLQDPQNKRIILPDATLGKVFGTTEPVEMFAIARLIGPHLNS